MNPLQCSRTQYDEAATTTRPLTALDVLTTPAARTPGAGRRDAASVVRRVSCSCCVWALWVPCACAQCCDVALGGVFVASVGWCRCYSLSSCCRCPLPWPCSPHLFAASSSARACPTLRPDRDGCHSFPGCAYDETSSTVGSLGGLKAALPPSLFSSPSRQFQFPYPLAVTVRFPDDPWVVGSRRLERNTRPPAAPVIVAPRHPPPPPPHMFRGFVFLLGTMQAAKITNGSMSFGLSRASLIALAIVFFVFGGLFLSLPFGACLLVHGSSSVCRLCPHLCPPLLPPLFIFGDVCGEHPPANPPMRPMSPTASVQLAPAGLAYGCVWYMSVAGGTSAKTRRRASCWHGTLSWRTIRSRCSQCRASSTHHRCSRTSRCSSFCRRTSSTATPRPCLRPPRKHPGRGQRHPRGADGSPLPHPYPHAPTAGTHPQHPAYGYSPASELQVMPHAYSYASPSELGELHPQRPGDPRAL